jgi:hypothetical protein
MGPKQRGTQLPKAASIAIRGGISILPSEGTIQPLAEADCCICNSWLGSG